MAAPNPRLGREGSTYTPNAPVVGTVSAYCATGFGEFLGFTAAELAGSTASFRIHDGSAAGATNALTSLITLSANQSVSDWYGPQGLAVANGVYLEMVAGRIEIVTYGA
jgi:hypothetical protein